jgi:hypothetical protein
MRIFLCFLQLKKKRREEKGENGVNFFLCDRNELSNKEEEDYWNMVSSLLLMIKGCSLVFLAGVFFVLPEDFPEEVDTAVKGNNEGNVFLILGQTNNQSHNTTAVSMKNMTAIKIQ